MKVLLAIIIVLFMWILYLYKRINELEEEKTKIIIDTIKVINDIRKKEKKNVK